MRYLGIVIEYETDTGKHELQFLAMGVSEKAQWMVDIAQVEEACKLSIHCGHYCFY